MSARRLLAAGLALSGCYDWDGARAAYCTQRPELRCDGGVAGGGSAGGLAGGGAAGGTSGGMTGGGVGGGVVLDAGCSVLNPPDATGVEVCIESTGIGRVVQLDGGRACDVGPCRLRVPPGSQLGFRTVPGPISVLTGFDAPCVQQPFGACLFDTGDAGGVVRANFDRPNVVFVTSQPTLLVTTALPEAHANAFCQGHAADAGLPGTYLALIGYPDRLDAGAAYNAAALLGQRRGWVRPDGRPVFDLLSASSADEPLYLPMLDEHGFPVAPTASVATGLGSNLQPSLHCASFTATGSSVSHGSPRLGGVGWLFPGLGNCDVPRRLYCFGNSANVPLQIDRSQPTRAIFLSQAQFNPLDGGGLAGADALCNADPARPLSDAGFVALLATTSNPARDRVMLSGAPWARADGVRVVDAADELDDGSLLAPIGHLPESVLTGANDLVSNASNACGNWTGVGATNANFGLATALDPEWFSIQTSGSCTFSHRLYCLQP